MISLLTDAPIDRQALGELVSGPEQGAIVSFAGTVRNHHRGRVVERLEYHAYRDMAERVLEEILAQCQAQYPSVRLALQHRLGWVPIGEDSVYVVAGSPHRAEAFAAARDVLEALKVDVPIWKKEFYRDGYVWVGDQLGPE